MEAIRPIPLEDLSGVPEGLRMGYKILKNAGYLPEELQLKKDIVSLKGILATCTSPEEKEETSRKLTLKQLRFEMLMEKQGQRLAVSEYQAKLETKLVD